MKKTIGVNTISYNQIRNYTGLPFEKYMFEKKQNIYKLPAHVYFKIKGKTHPYFWNTFMDLNYHKVELFHFFNALNLGKTPWITTFETSIPRWSNDKLVEKGLRLIAKDSCKKIIAMSECTANIQRKLVAEKYPEFIDIINEKLIVLHPAQKCDLNIVKPKKNFDRIVFTIVGADFFRKGGKELLSTFDRLMDDGFDNWELNIISSLQYGDYASHADEDDLRYAKNIIAKYPNNIQHHFRLPNSEVLELFRTSDVGLLPTYADTYGYSILESQAYQCPVISTNIRAIPEINNDDIGWLIKVPKNDIGNGILETKKDREYFSKTISDQMYTIIQGILTSPEIIIKKGLKAFNQISKSIEHNTTTLEKIYDKIVAEQSKK